MSEENKSMNKEFSTTKKIEPYTPQFNAMLPSSTQKFLRTCLIWQFIRFIVINIKMMVLIFKSHH